MKKTLFISYSHDAIDRDKLDYLLDQISKKGRSTIRILIDHKDVHLGGSFADYMTLIESHDVDAVLVVLTPSYKTKVDRNEGSVPSEFRAIYTRYEADRDRIQAAKKSSDLQLYEIFREFGLLPVVLTGHQKDSVPDLLINEKLRYLDASSTVVHRDRDNKLVAPGASSKQLDEIAEQVVSDLKNIAKNRNRGYQENRSRIRAFLFANTKAGAAPHLESEVFVKTITYQKVVGQESHFIVGRKGSGKSTLTDQLDRQNPNTYTNQIKIDFSEVSLSFIYSYYTSKQFQSDVQSIQGYRAQFLELVWECFFLSHFAWHHKNIQSLKEWLITAFGQDFADSDPRDYCDSTLSYCLEKYQEFQNKVINTSKDSFSTIPARLKRTRFLEYVYGKDVLRTIVETHTVSGGVVLITLDGIDSAFHDYRLEYMRYSSGSSPEYVQGRARVEVDLIKALMRLISDIKAKPYNYQLLGTAHFCITIPLDLYQEVKEHHERDSYQWLTSCRSLEWSGHELALMMRKRIEKLSSCEINKVKYPSPKERLTKALDDIYPGLPKEIPVTIGSRVVRYPIFIYVLRHSFWRPREIILHFVGLISSFEFFKSSIPIEEADVKAIVKEQAKALISSEFIDEFKSTITNIEEIIEHFRDGKQYFEWSEFLAFISGIELVYFSPHDKKPSNGLHKARLLYEIGFIGIRLTDEQMANHRRPRTVFSFCEGMVIFDEISRESFIGTVVCIHPAFIEYLGLRIHPDQEIAMDIDWEYVRENEVRRNAALQW